jgi:hypothetical protein
LIGVSSKSFTINLTFEIDELEFLFDDFVNSSLNFLYSCVVIAVVSARLEYITVYI